MAHTYTAAASGVSYASGKSMLALFNGAATAKVLRVYRIWVLNNGTSAVTGVLTNFTIYKTSAQSGGTSVTPVKHDSNNDALDAAVLCAYGATVTDGSLLRKFLFSNDEPAVSGATLDEFELLVPLNCVWDAGYGDTTIQPITLNASEGLHVKHTGTTAVGSCDIYFEFTQAAS